MFADRPLLNISDHLGCLLTANGLSSVICMSPCRAANIYFSKRPIGTTKYPTVLSSIGLTDSALARAFSVSKFATLIAARREAARRGEPWINAALRSDPIGAAGGEGRVN
jgi:hypothetical protein